jgi:uncharacterized protein YkwD
MWFHLMPEEFKQSAAHQRSSRSAGWSKTMRTNSNNNLVTTAPPSPPPCSIGYYSSAHLLVNMERQRNGAGPLQRSVRLDDLAKQHAKFLAQAGTLRHSAHSLQELKEKLQASNVGESAQRGDSIREMHETAMQGAMMIDRDDGDNRPHDDEDNTRMRNDHDAPRQSSSRILADNILSPSFTEIGIGTAVSSSDGKLYMVQLYRGGHWI